MEQHKHLIAFLLCFGCLTSFYIKVEGQNSKFVEDSLKAVELNRLAWSIRNSDPDSSESLARRAMELAMINNISELKLQAFNYMGVAERNQGNYGEASRLYMAALRISEEKKNYSQKGYTLINIGNLYIYQQDFNQAFTYLENALEIADSLNDQNMRAYCFLNMGRAKRGANELNKAEDFFLKSLEIRKVLNDTSSQVTLKVELAEVFRQEGNLEKALEYYRSGLDNINTIKNYGALSYSFNNISKIYLEQGKLDTAQLYAKYSNDIAEQLNDKYDLQKAKQNLSIIFEQKGDYKNAIKYLKEFNDLKDSIFSEENTRNMERLISGFESEKIKSQNSLLQERNELNNKVIEIQKMIIVLALVGLALLGVIFIIIYKAYKVRKKLNLEILKQKDQIENDKDLIEVQSKKLEELDRAKSRFFTNISHDLRSPLSLIIGNIENVMDNEDNYLSPISKENLDTGYKNSKRLLYLADEINELTKLEEGKLKFEKEAVEIGLYLKLLVKMFSSAAEYKNIQLTFKSEIEDNVPIELDPRHFEKIIYNLISNAIEHTPIEGNVEVTLKQNDDNLSVEISDDGEGISKQSLPYIFDRYYQSPTNQYRIREGLGIGLALVKELVDLHKGEINVQSTAGKGTKFIIDLPFVKDLKTTAFAPEQSAYIQEKNHLWSELLKKNQFSEKQTNIKVNNLEKDKTKTILIVDDHPEVREYIKNLLITYFTIYEAGNGNEAIHILKTSSVDLVITDLMMPWMDGFELLQVMHNDPSMNKIPALVVSARTNDEDKRKVLFRGINNILYKPFDRHELILRVNNLINFKDNIEKDNSDKLLISNSKTISDIEKGIMEKIDSLIIENIDNPALSVNHLGDVLAASERKVYRMVKKLTNMTPLEYIKEVRWKYLEVLIREKNVKNATEAAKSIGINNVTKFKQQYEKKFGKKIDHILDYGVE